MSELSMCCFSNLVLIRFTDVCKADCSLMVSAGVKAETNVREWLVARLVVATQVVVTRTRRAPDEAAGTWQQT